jgi:serine/threonine-protein kinase
VPRVRRPHKIRSVIACVALAALGIAGGLGWWWLAARQTATAPKQIAVLPLTPIGGEAENRLVSDGLAEVLTTRLTELERLSGSLRIVPSSEVRREQITSARDARRAFGVDLVVTGSIQQTGDRLRVTLNVVDPLTLRIVSAETLDATTQDASLLQDEVVLRVARLLGLDVGPAARTLVSAGGTSAPGAYEYYLQGRAYLQRPERPENVDAALSLFERALALDAKFALAHAALAEASWRKYEGTRASTWIDRARAAGETAIELSPTLAQARITLAIVAAGTGRYEEAVTALEAVLAEHPTNADAYRELARAYESLGAVDKAESTFLRAIHARPGDWLAYNQLGAFFSRRRNFASAAVQFEQVIALTPDNARGYSNLGGTYAQLGRYVEAIAALEKAVHLNATTAALSNLGTIYFLQDRYADAARAFERAAESRAGDYRIWRNLGSAYLWTPDSADKARRAFARAAALAEEERKINPRQPTLLADLADCYAHLGRVDEARSLIDQAEAMTPKDGHIFLLSAQIHEHLGNRPLALDKVAAALERGITRAEVERTKSLDALRADPAFKAARD